MTSISPPGFTVSGHRTGEPGKRGSAAVQSIQAERGQDSQEYFGLRRAFVWPPLNLPQIRAITDHDDMDLYTLGEKKCALYAVIPDNDNTFNSWCPCSIPRRFRRFITARTRSIMGRCPGTSTLYWMSLRLCRCQGTLVNWPPCGSRNISSAPSFRTWPRSRSCTRTPGKPSPATRTPSSIWAATSRAPISTSPRPWARPPSIQRPMGRPKANRAPTPPISR